MRTTRVCAVSIAFMLTFAFWLEGCSNSKQYHRNDKVEDFENVAEVTQMPTATVKVTDTLTTADIVEDVEKPEPTETNVEPVASLEKVDELEVKNPEESVSGELEETDEEWKKVLEEIEADRIITVEEIVKFLDAYQVSYCYAPCAEDMITFVFVLYTTEFSLGKYPVVLYLTDGICTNWDESIEYIENNPEKFVKKISTLEELTDFIFFWNYRWKDAFTVSLSDDSSSFIVKSTVEEKSFIVPLDENGEISIVELEKILLDNISVVLRGKKLLLPKPWTFIENWDG